MDVEKVEAKVENMKHSLKKYNLKQFLIENERILSRYFKLIHNAANTDDIRTIWINRCVLVEFPRAHILLNLVKNLTSLSVIECNLTQITSDNLCGLGSLKELYLGFNSIESLPKGLFVHTPKLEIVSFWHNRIKEIDENILDPLNKLKYFCLSDNLKINVKFNIINNGGNVTLAQLKEEIKKCRPNEEIIKDLRRENDSLREKNIELTKDVQAIKKNHETIRKDFAEIKSENVHIKVENQNLKMSDEMLRKEVGELKTNCAKLTAELNQLKAAKSFNFTVVVNGKDFQVNKDVLAANSPVLAKLIGENPDVNDLVLRDVSEETFEEIHKFMMIKNPPREAANLIELYAASARLEMNDLMELTAEILMGKVTTENAPDIIKMSLKYNHEELTKKALGELNKKFGEN